MDCSALARKHPFINGLRNPPPNRGKDLRRVRSWIATQPHLPSISDEYIFLFLHACYYNHERVKHAMETYFTLRANSPSLFADRDVYHEKLQRMLQMAHLTRLPKLTPEGYRVLMYIIKDSDPAEFYFTEAVKGFCMYNDCMLSEDGLAEGYVVILDMKNVKLGHLARVSLPSLRAFMVYIQEAHPARLKAVHVLNTATWINHVMRIIAPMVRSDMISLVKFHGGDLPEDIPKEILPMDYGGEAPTAEELGREVFELIEKYKGWLRDSEYFVADESKRLKKSSWWSIFSGANGSANPNSLGIDTSAPATFRNLELD